MRIHIVTTPNDEIVPFEYQQKLVGTLHKWLGKCNKEHGTLSLYSFSWLLNGCRQNQGLNFANGAKLFISFYDESRIKQIVKTILEDPYMFSGMQVKDVVIEQDPDLSSRELFYVASPVFIKRRDESGKNVFYFYDDSDANSLMRESLLHKMEEVGLEKDDSLEIKFDLSYNKKTKKMMTYDGICNKASVCPVLIQGRPETKIFAWNVGVGNSTGIGFGAIY